MRHTWANAGVSVAIATAAFLLCAPAKAQTPDSAGPAAESPILPAPPAQPIFNEERILGVIPDYQTVEDSSRKVTPLTVKQKWQLALKETVDPFNIASGFLTAAMSQAGNDTPKYGEGWAAFGKRVGAAQADFATQNFFSAGLLAGVLHQDPRYFRKGPETGIFKRVAYSLSRVVIARDDSGKTDFNYSGIFGMALGIAASNLYYPSASMHGYVMADRIQTSATGSVIGNLMSEFWPDLQKKFFRKHTNKN